MIIVICLKKLDRQTKRSIKQHYSLLEFKKSQIKKSIPQLGTADVLLFELDISMIFNVKNNIIYKYLKSQDLTSIKVVWVYESSKYKNLIDNVNVFLRKFPLLYHKNIDEALEIQEEREKDIKTKFEPLSFVDEDISMFLGTSKHATRLEELQQSLITLIDEYKDEEKKHKSLITDYSEQLSKLHEENKRLSEELKKIEVGLEQKPACFQCLEKRKEPEEKEKIDIIVKAKKIFVSSSTRGVVEVVDFKGALDRRKHLTALKKKYS
jgi:hypothetical protein